MCPSTVQLNDHVPETPTLAAEAVTGGTVQDWQGIRLTTEPVPMPENQNITILLVCDEGFEAKGLHISSSNGEEADVTSDKFNLNRYDIPATFFAENGQVVVTPVFALLPAGEQRAQLRWRYVWGDEFTSAANEYAKPDATKWGTPTRHSSAWNRFIADTDSTSFLRDGYYHARCFANPNRTTDNAAMLSGAIQSSGLYSFCYGRVEARIKTTRHSGNFPAFWMMPQDNSIGWPNAGEIDIWEQINREHYAHHTIHTNWTYNLGKKNDPKSSSNEWANMDEWHVYALEWDKSQLRWYLDGVQVFSYSKKAADADALSKGQWPFDKPFYIILNQSVGNGSWAANPDEGFIYETLFDYVRVYQIEKSGEDNVSYPINYPKAQPVTHASRRLIAVGLDDNLLEVPNSACLYNFIEEPGLNVIQGQVVQPKLEFSGNWMHGYVYLDLDGDSIFTPLPPQKGVQPAFSELMSYSFYSEGSDVGSGYNSEGTAIPVGGQNTMQMPTFTIPGTLASGLYRMRFKVDWDDIDAGGSMKPGNDILRNGGAICDVNIRVEGPTGIGSLSFGGNGKTHVWYDLQGRRIVPSTTSGIYIRDGRKVVIK